MALDDPLIRVLEQAIQDYDFPCVTFDFASQRELENPTMREVETEIRSQLLAESIEAVKDGLSNVLYWGYARTGYGPTRVKRFRDNVWDAELARAGEVFREMSGPGVRQIARLHLPEFSGLSFTSKVRMFLDPINYVVLDLKLANLEVDSHTHILHQIHAYSSTIRVTKHNEAVYEQWSQLCRRIAIEYFSYAALRAVDVERGIFHLVQAGSGREAAKILERA